MLDNLNFLNSLPFPSSNFEFRKHSNGDNLQIKLICHAAASNDENRAFVVTKTVVFIQHLAPAEACRLGSAEHSVLNFNLTDAFAV